jgi:hypothetical protein
MPSSCGCCGQVSEVLAPLPGVLGQLTPVFRWSFLLCPKRPPATLCQACGLVSADYRLKGAGVVNFLSGW